MAVHRPLSITDIWPCSGTSSLYSFNKYSLLIYLVPGTALSPGYITMNETEEKKNPSFCSPNIPRDGLPQGLCTCCSSSLATYFPLHLASLLLTHQVLVKHLCSGKPPLCPWVKSSPQLSSPAPSLHGNSLDTHPIWREKQKGAVVRAQIPAPQAAWVQILVSH